MMNLPDIIILVFLLWGLLLGIKKGFVSQLATISALAAGIYGAIELSGRVEEVLIKNGSTGSYLPAIAFALVFVVVVILVFMLGKFVEGSVKLMALGWLNRLAGGVFGVAKFLLFSSVVIYLLQITGLDETMMDNETIQQSVFYKTLSDNIPLVAEKLKDLL